MLFKINEKEKELNEKTEKQDKKLFEMAALNQINHSLSFTHNLDEIYTKLVENVLNVMNGIQTCIVLVVDELHNEFEYKVIKGLNTESIPENKRVPLDSLIASKVYQTGENLVINETVSKQEGNISNDSGNSDSNTILKQDKSFYIPIIVKGKVIAVLFGKNKLSGEDFSESDLSLIEGIIKETSTAIRNAMMWQDLHRKILELNTLHEIAKNIGTVLDINKLLELILDLTAKVFGGVKTSSIILYDEETKLLNLKLYKGEKSSKAMKPIKSGEGIAGKVFQRGEPIMINDMHTNNNDSIDAGSSSICVPLKVKEKCLGVLSITDKLSGEPFDKSDLDMMVTLASQIAVSLNNAKLYEDLEASYLSAVRALANSIDAKDTYTMGHSERVAKYSVEIGKKMGLPEEEIKNLYIGALLHDIGKIGIPEAIINKTDRLTNEEYQEIKTHPSRGAMIIEPAKFLKEKVPLIKYHHERFDGKGYPEGLKGEEIPLLARIICCADSFDAMTSKRAYRDTMPLEFAKKELIRCSETQFDPRIVNAFLEVIANEDTIKEIRNM
jgi:HD-GYP domain-containing protein (c-di-GMP phosphodiesterase class II)